MNSGGPIGGKIQLDESPERGPPLRQVLNLISPSLGLFHARPFYLLTRYLRQRRTGEIRPEPDVPKSIRGTLEAGGLPFLEWSTSSLPSQYLILIERRSGKDHLAHVFAELARELSSRDISVEAYFYQREPRVCYRFLDSQEAIPLSRLISQYGGYRLLLIGEGEDLLEPGTRRAADWLSQLTAWPERAFLSTRATEAWDQREMALAKELLVVPATTLGFQSLVVQWQAEEPHNPRWWRKYKYELAPPKESGPGIVEELRVYLGETGLNWLAACAWYPELLFPLTLQLGNLIQELEPHAPTPFDLDFLLHLFRLEGFRTGSLPREVREQLAEALPEEQARQIREHLKEVLTRKENLPPAGSYAEGDHQVRMALFTYLNSSRDLTAQKALKKAIQGLDPEEWEDLLVFRELGKIKPSVLSLILPARYFFGRIPLLGLRQRVRMSLIGIPLLLAALFWGISGPEEPYHSEMDYPDSELALDTDRDRARVAVHRGYLRYGQDSTQGAYFEEALRWDSTFAKARHNGIAVRNNQALGYYYSSEFQRAIDTLEQANHLLFGRKEQMPDEYLTIHFSLGAGNWEAQNYEEALSHWMTVFCSSTATPPVDQIFDQDDLSYQTFLRMIDEPMVLVGERVDQQMISGDATLTFTAEKLKNCLGILPDCEGVVVLSGTVYDEAGEVLAGAQIRGVGSRLNTVSTSLGQFELRIDTCIGETLPRALEGQLAGYLPVEQPLAAGNIQALRLVMTPDTTQPPPQELWIHLTTTNPENALSLNDLYLQLARADRALALSRTRWEEGRRLYADEPDIVENRRLRMQADSITSDSLSALLTASLINLEDLQPLSGVQLTAGTVTSQEVRPGSYVLRLDSTANVRLLADKEGYVRLDTLVEWRSDTLALTLLPKPPVISEVPFPEMVLIQGGTFDMGSEEGDEDEIPIQQVSLSDFYLGKYEVTFEEYDRFCEATNRDNPEDGGWGRGRRPVINVSWYDALEYCNWLSEQHGFLPAYQIDKKKQDPNNENAVDDLKWTIRLIPQANGYRLPTEAQWEYAAKGGRLSRGYTYAGSNDIDSVGWYVGNANESTQIVGQKKGNEAQLFDMSGNVYEWCQDWYGDYSAGPLKDPKGPESGGRRVFRGGSWDLYAYFCRVAYRNGYPPRCPPQRCRFSSS